MSNCLTVTFGNETKKLAVNEPASYEQAYAQIAKEFGLEMNSFVLKFEDEDGDICNITSDFELAFVLQGREAKGAYTVFVSRIDSVWKPSDSNGLQVPGHCVLPPLSSDESTLLHKQRMLLLRAADMQRLASEYARQAAECQSQSANYQQQASDLMAAAAALVSKPQ